MPQFFDDEEISDEDSDLSDFASKLDKKKRN